MALSFYYIERTPHFSMGEIVLKSKKSAINFPRTLAGQIPGGDRGIVIPTHFRSWAPFTARTLCALVPNPATDGCGWFVHTRYTRHKFSPRRRGKLLAEIGGFEPSIQFPVYTISSRAHSTSSAISPVPVLLHWFIRFARGLYFKIVIFDRFDDCGDKFILVR